ncbi:bacteriophage N4 adsorption protein B [Sphingomonas taxi]|uniref:Bacteriophage N4 adsorption protein B n=1 Tax=Sphingomonas taxi TaxID=1549858 RepID=A0A097EKZ8_9SPHN|nr:glycosyl transferase family protein [Sphingomonas taxi]AIT08249.1 bacteriophage N4 adsorption protein B [Sphingomonas taxi]
MVVLDGAVRESMLFAATWFLIGGVDDLGVDLCFFVDRLRHWQAPRRWVSDLPERAVPALFAIFVPAWREEAVIGAMLAATTSRFGDSGYRVYVGVYPNDPATIEAAQGFAERDPRIRVIVGPRDGPTTKADCLNILWAALERDDAAAERPTEAIVIHDAEDVVHPAELRVFDALLQSYAVVQVPVLPLIRSGSLVSGHYADEFAYAHGMQQPVRAMLGAPLPLAGTGCAIRTDVLGEIAVERGGAPFDASCLTEDYELGLHVAGRGGGVCFARIWDPHDRSLVAVRAYFPETFQTAIRQKARWMTGIALAGWDRIGWGLPGAFADHWMRMRDRRALISVVVLGVAYGAILLWVAVATAHWLSGVPDTGQHIAGWLCWTTTLLLGWRVAVRIVCTTSAYGWREGCWSVPRVLVANLIALLATPLALRRYALFLRGDSPVWDKTVHAFPDIDTLG